MADRDLDFDIDQTLKSARRSNNRRRREIVEEDNLDDVLDSVLASNTKQQPQPQPRRSSRTKEDIQPAIGNHAKQSNNSNALSGWGEDDFNPNNLRSKKESGGASFDFGDSKTSSKINKREINKNDELDIPEIPDLEEQTDMTEDMAFQVAEAPDVQVHQISTYKELDKEFFREKAFQFLEGNIDVSLLHCGLNTENQIAEEEDVIWDWTKLFTEVVSTLTAASEAETAEDPFGTSDELKADFKSDSGTLAATTTSKRPREKDSLLF